MYDWYPKEWWTKIDRSIDCTADDLARFLDKVFTLRRYPEADDVSATTEAGIVRKICLFTNLVVYTRHVVVYTVSDGIC